MSATSNTTLKGKDLITVGIFSAISFVIIFAVAMLGYIPIFMLLLGTSGIITRFMPSVMMGMYVVSTTTVSEFTAAMQRMRVTEKLIIPLSVMFRLFPSIADEFDSINAAMRMREVSFGGRNWTKMPEYHLIPLLTCSVQQPEVFVLDEPIGGLDFRSMEQTAELISSLRGRRTVFIATHDPELIVRCCTHILHPKHGKAAENYPFNAENSDKLMFFRSKGVG